MHHLTISASFGRTVIWPSRQTSLAARSLLQAPAITQLWLHTRDDAVSLASVRSALNNPKFHFTNLVDRRLLLVTLQSDPLYLVLDGVLIMGTVTAFLVALVGDVLASWLSARTRQMIFATLRALGTTTSKLSAS